MKKIALFTLFLLLVTTSLNAYSKKIVFSAFSNAQNASKSLEEYKNTSEYKRLFELSQENNFKIYYRESGKYFVIIAEPILNLAVGIEAFDLIKSKYKSAYTMVYKEEKKAIEAKKIVIAKKVVKKIVPTVEDKNSKVSKIEIVEEIKESNKTVVLKSEQNSTTVEIEKTIKQQEKKEIISEIYKEEKKDFIDIWTVIRYIVIFFFLFVVTFYYIKFKRLYDEY